MRSVFKVLVIGFFFGISVSGCMAVSDSGYYWGKYSYTYLNVVRNPSEAATEKHIAELKEILEKSDKEGLKPAPGLCAELAFWLVKADAGNVGEARALYAREMQIYPEAKTFIERLSSN